MAASRARTSSFYRNFSIASASQTPGLKSGPNGTTYVSSGIPDLDKIIGGGYPLGSLIILMEDPEAPHHMLLLRNFMSQGLVHGQQVLYSSPSHDPRGFLGTLPTPVSFKDHKSRIHDPDQDKGLRIAWQYKKYFGENPYNADGHKDNNREYSNDFDLRKPLERHFISGQRVDCVGMLDSSGLSAIASRCSSFLSHFRRSGGQVSSVGRIAIQSLCSPQCEYSEREWEVLSFVRSLKGMIASSNAVAFITYPPFLSPHLSKRLQHMADTMISVRAIPDEDKELGMLLTGYQDMVGFLSVHKVANFNTQVPVVLNTTTFSIRLHKRKFLVLEALNQAPVDGSDEPGKSDRCSGSWTAGRALEF